MKKTIFMFAAALLILKGSGAFAQGEWLDAPLGIRPDSPLYIIETIKENLTLLLTFNTKAKAEKLLRLAEERLAEAEAMATFKKPKLVEKMLARYESRLKATEEYIARAKGEGKDVEALKERLTGSYLRHQAVLQNVLERVPEEAKDTVEHAIEVSQKGYEQVVESISKEKQEGVLEKVKERIPNFRKRIPKGLEKKLFPAEEVETEETEETEE